MVAVGVSIIGSVTFWSAFLAPKEPARCPLPPSVLSRVLQCSQTPCLLVLGVYFICTAFSAHLFNHPAPVYGPSLLCAQTAWDVVCHSHFCMSLCVGCVSSSLGVK